ncbi:DUF1684 domain-containing protein [Herbiconiux sp. A18JL235]|uniref:DUF1684 domain-containing protein n=1 Tax=Herbiconiux sp. A18JL235 TaxID=3152363 RepID=A0AB39BDG7_9MICO
MSDSEFEKAWGSWHEARLRTVTAPHGTASLVATHWLTAEPQRLHGLEGSWHLDDGAVVGDDFTIEEGGETLVGRLLLRHFRRDDDVAVRVLDPEATSRASVDGISAYSPDEAWVLKGRFTPAPVDATVELHLVDGYVESSRLAGTIALEVDGREVELVATGDASGMLVVFGDTTNGDETYRFRFLKLRADAGGGEIEVDFNRAYLPPCAFADFYVCPFPPPQNRLDVPVRAGEKSVVRSTEGSAVA